MVAKRMQELDLADAPERDRDFFPFVRSSGDSPETFVDMRLPASALDYGQLYDFGFNLTTPPTALAVIGYCCIGRAITIPADFDNGVDVAVAGKLPSGANPDTDYEIAVMADADLIGAITVSSTGIVTWETIVPMDIDLDAGTIVSFVAPDQGSAQDISISGWSFNINARTRLPVT